MEHKTDSLPALASQFIHKNFLVLLVFSYALAAIAPHFGLWLRHIQFGQVHLPDGGSLKLSLALLMLSFLLLNAGLGIKTRELTGL